jgi:hypothetical protein
MPEEEAVKIGGNSYLTVNEVVHYTPQNRSGGIRPCIAAAQIKQLNGGEGNAMRVAVIREILANGGSRQDCIDAFRGQEDFDEVVTAYHVDKLMATSDKHGSWHCHTLSDQCPNLVDCNKCPLAPVIEFPEKGDVCT